MIKNWRLNSTAPAEFKISQYNQIILNLLYQRGLKTETDVEDFLNPDYDAHIHDPFHFSQMEIAINRIMSAIKNDEKIMVYGDYDADGVCSSTIIYQTLRSLGVDVDIYIPYRESEGYGLNKKAVNWLINQKINLIVTVDCGISNKDEIAMLNEAGIDVIVTDHHQEPKELPPALAIINPSCQNAGYPFKYLCGAGVAFKLVQALMIKQHEADFPIKLPAGYDKWLLDIAAIATVGDMVPLIGENRILVKYGLVVLEKSRNIGLQKMLSKISNYSKKIDTQYLGWRLVPRINAAGRIEHASMAFNLLTSTNENEAEKLINLLEENNKNRQSVTEKILKSAIEQVEPKLENSKILFACGDNWTAGVVGLVAGKLTDRYHRPSLVISKEGDKYVGSGRSIEEFDITAALSKCSEYLDRFGGHPQACGFTVRGEENFNIFIEIMTSLANDALKDIQLAPILNIDAEVRLSEINWDLLSCLEKFEPFGEGNAKPLFLARDLLIEKIQTLGSDNKHLRVMVSQDQNLNHIQKLIGFSFGEWYAKLQIGDKIDVVFELDVNEWNGNRELQLKIIDLKLSE